MKNVSDEICRQCQNPCFVFNIFFIEKRAVYEIMCKDILKAGRPQLTIWRMRTKFWLPKAINTHSEYVILIAFPVLLTQYCAGDKIKKNEMGGACSAYGGGERCVQGFCGET